MSFWLNKKIAFATFGVFALLPIVCLAKPRAPILKNANAKAAAATLERGGVTVVNCPQYMAKPATGLYSSINAANTLCIRGATTKSGASMLARLPKISLPFDGKLIGVPFTPVEAESFDPAQADINTDSFVEQNYPAAIAFLISNANHTAEYNFKIMDPSHDPASILKTAVSGWSPGYGILDWVGPGEFYLNISSNLDNEGNQAFYDARMMFMDQYQGTPIPKAKMSQVKPVSCPTYFYDFWGKKLIRTNGFVCSNTNPASAGLTAAPFDFRMGLYLSQNVTPFDDYPFVDPVDFQGASQAFPFRILKPTLVSFSVDDPSEDGGGHPGTTDINIINIASGTKSLFAHVDGSTQGDGTHSYLNAPGDYMIDIERHPNQPSKYGDILCTVTLQGSD